MRFVLENVTDRFDEMIEDEAEINVKIDWRDMFMNLREDYTLRKDVVKDLKIENMQLRGELNHKDSTIQSLLQKIETLKDRLHDIKNK